MSSYFAKHFWKWLEKYNMEYTRLHKKPKREAKFWLDELGAHLKAYCKRLDFVLYQEHDKKLLQLVISASGDCRFFRRAELLVKKAPALPGWTFTALHPPRAIDFTIHEKYGDTGIDPHNLWFKPFKNNVQGKQLNIIIYSELYRDEVKDGFYDAVLDVVCNVLGERNFGLNMGIIRVANLSVAPAKQKLFKLEKLPAYVKKMQLQFEVNERGILKERIPA
jgi:hypothetical protein